MEIVVESPAVKYSERYIEAEYDYQYTTAEIKDDKIVVKPALEKLVLRTERKVPKLGVMLVGWGGNNGSTFTAALIANKLGLKWKTRKGIQSANWYGSLTQCGTVHIGSDIHVPISQVLPTVQPDDIVVDGWDISDDNLVEAMEKAQVLDPSLQSQLKEHMANMQPRPSIYFSDYTATNQEVRATNVMKARTLSDMVTQVMIDIDDFKSKSGVDKVILLWTASTERRCDVIPNVNDTAENLLKSIKNGHSEVSPSTLFAVAAISKGCTFINGSPQNTFVPGVIELAQSKGVFIAGDDFKSGQTKIKSVLVDFLVGAGIKPVSIVSYNHLGNNDGKNLSEPKQFHSKEVSKTNVVDDMVKSNNILYKPGEKPDHVVEIKYVPYVGDSKRAMDEYISEIMMGGTNTLVLHNTCEDSLLATPIILDLAILAELFSRVQIKRQHWSDENYSSFHSVLSLLSYLCKAPLVPNGTPVVNALMRQRACIENVMKACLGLPPDNSMTLEHKIPFMMAKTLKPNDYTSLNGFSEHNGTKESQ